MILRTLQKVIKQHVTIPAPEVLEDDPWFGPAPETERSLELKLAKEKAILEKQLLDCDSDNHHPLHHEDDNIHQKMYEIATQGGNTTTQLDPMPELGGGSEQYQTGPGGWMSGTGMRQFH